MKTISKLTFKEEEVMHLFWSIKEPKTALELSKLENVSMNTIKITIPRLLEKGFIEVVGLGYSGTTVARTFQAKISAEEYLANQLQTMRSSILNFSTLKFVEEFLTHNDKNTRDLNEIESIIQRLKEEE